MLQIKPLAISTLHVMRTAACLLWLDASSFRVMGCSKVLQKPNECHVTAIRFWWGLQNHTVLLWDRVICSVSVSFDIPWPYLKSKVMVKPKNNSFSFGLYCAITIAFHLQEFYIYTGLVLHSDEVLVIVGFLCIEQWTICGAFGQPWATLYLFRLSSMCGFAGALVFCLFSWSFMFVV